MAGGLKGTLARAMILSLQVQSLVTSEFKYDGKPLDENGESRFGSWPSDNKQYKTCDYDNGE